MTRTREFNNDQLHIAWSENLVASQPCDLFLLCLQVSIRGILLFFPASGNDVHFHSYNLGAEWCVLPLCALYNNCSSSYIFYSFCLSHFSTSRLMTDFGFYYLPIMDIFSLVWQFSPKSWIFMRVPQLCQGLCILETLKLGLSSWHIMCIFFLSDLILFNVWL